MINRLHIQGARERPRPKYTDKHWRNAPICSTCEVVMQWEPRVRCGKSTAAAYPAMNDGWMALCTMHAKPHPEATPVAELRKAGETFA